MGREHFQRYLVCLSSRHYKQVGQIRQDRSRQGRRSQVSRAASRFRREIQPQPIRHPRTQCRNSIRLSARISD